MRAVVYMLIFLHIIRSLFVMIFECDHYYDHNITTTVICKMSHNKSALVIENKYISLFVLFWINCLKADFLAINEIIPLGRVCVLSLKEVEYKIKLSEVDMAGLNTIKQWRALLALKMFLGM